MKTQRKCRPLAVAGTIFAAMASGAASAGGPPANDDCANAIPVTDSITGTQFSTVYATTDGNPIPHTMCSQLNLIEQIANDVWFEYTADCTGTVTFSTCGSAFDTKMAVYDACGAASPPSNAALLACDDRGCGFQAEVTIDVVQGQCYKIRIGSPAFEGPNEGPTGLGFLDIHCKPANDDCANAIEVFDGDNAFSTLGATTDGLQHDVSCNGLDPDEALLAHADVWYTYTATSTGTATFSTSDPCGGLAAVMAVYAGCDSNACPPETVDLLACGASTQQAGCIEQSQVTVDVTAGECYFIRIGSKVNEFNQGSGVLSISSTPSVGSCCLNNTCVDVVTLDDCVALDGTFLGDESTCAETFNGDDAPAACDADCNANGVLDFEDIASGVADDCDLDGEPDSCVAPLPFDGYSMEFMDVDDRAIRDSFSGFPSNNLTVSMWVKTADITRNSGLFSYAVPGSSNELVLSTQNNLTLSAQGSTKSSNVSIADGAWHHVAVTFTDFGPVDNAVLYVDGQFVWTTNFTSNEDFTNGGTIVLGDEQDCLGGCFAADEALIGHIDEVRVWNVARTASQINSDMNTQLTGNETGLVGYWQFNEASGDVADDLAGSNDMMLVGGPAWLPTGGCAVPGDIDGDNIIGVSDLLILLGEWGACAEPDDCPADLDGDNHVGVGDLLTLLANWS